MRPKIIANSRLTIKYYIVESEGVHIQFILIKIISSKINLAKRRCALNQAVLIIFHEIECN